MQVRVASSLFDYYDREEGVPQRGVLSTSLFNIEINDIEKCLGYLTDCSLCLPPSGSGDILLFLVRPSVHLPVRYKIL